MSMNKKNIIQSIILLSLGLLTILFLSSAYIVPEAKQVVVTQFGRPIGKPITEAGLYFKIPFIQELRFVDKRILSWDGEPNEVRTGDNKFIRVDTTARYQISDALRFIQTVQNESGAQTRLDTILDAATRDVISNHKLVEAVRDTNNIIDEVERRKEKAKEDELEVEEELIGDIERISVGREQLSAMIAEQAEERLQQFGITLVDVQLRRISYEKSVEQRVYERMVSERVRIAEKLRSLGKGEQAKIEGRISRELQTIESAAYQRAQALIGAAEAEAIRVYSRSVGNDPAFYEFLRKLQAYEKAIKPETEMLLTTDSEFLSLFKKK
jgi:modulator of FtsH protease HflC